MIKEAFAAMAEEKKAVEEKQAAVAEAAASQADPTVDAAAVEAKKAAEAAPTGGARIRNFVLEAADDVAEGATSILSVTSAATLRAVYATGSAASKVCGGGGGLRQSVGVLFHCTMLLLLASSPSSPCPPAPAASTPGA